MSSGPTFRVGSDGTTSGSSPCTSTSASDLGDDATTTRCWFQVRAPDPTATASTPTPTPSRPNIVFILSDDHAAHAISAYGSDINLTPQLDRIADQGVRFDTCICTNSICTPSRASILTGSYSHVNQVTTLDTPLDNQLPTFVSQLHEVGYATALFGKWHLGHGPQHDPASFDEWKVLPGQGEYHDPEFLGPQGRVQYRGYVTDLITDLALAWLDERDRDQPFCLLVHHKAPHRAWEPDDKHATMYSGMDIPEPTTLFDDFATRSGAASSARMRLEDLTEVDLKGPVPSGLSPRQERQWRYQRYIADYLRVVASMDDNVGRVLDALDNHGIAEDTLVVYASDQGFFLGDHGWFDKRLIYEQSLRMPLMMRWPGTIPPGTSVKRLVSNVDLAQTLCDVAGVAPPPGAQGRSLTPFLRGEEPDDWPRQVYYRYWMHDDADHGVWAHYGLRTERWKLVCFYNDGLGQAGADRGPDAPLRPPVEWELYDIDNDPDELHNAIADPRHADILVELVQLLADEQHRVGDLPHPHAAAALPTVEHTVSS